MINSLLPGSQLNSEFWPEGVTGKLNPEIRKKLLQVALDFKQDLDLKEVGLDGQIVIKDVIFTGSLANYNWSNQSDVDLHIRVDLKDVQPEYLALAKQYLQVKRWLYAYERDPKIYEFDVEVYPEDISEHLAASAIYSLIQDQWIKEPKKENVEVDKAFIARKAKALMDFIDRLIEAGETEPYEKMINVIERVKKKIKKLRQASLEKGGEFHEGNLIFKVLRRTDYLEKLDNFKKDLINKHLSLK